MIEPVHLPLPAADVDTGERSKGDAANVACQCSPGFAPVGAEVITDPQLTRAERDTIGFDGVAGYVRVGNQRGVGLDCIARIECHDNFIGVRWVGIVPAIGSLDKKRYGFWRRAGRVHLAARWGSRHQNLVGIIPIDRRGLHISQVHRGVSMIACIGLVGRGPKFITGITDTSVAFGPAQNHAFVRRVQGEGSHALSIQSGILGCKYFAGAGRLVGRKNPAIAAHPQRRGGTDWKCHRIDIRRHRSTDVDGRHPGGSAVHADVGPVQGRGPGSRAAARIVGSSTAEKHPVAVGRIDGDRLMNLALGTAKTAVGRGWKAADCLPGRGGDTEVGAQELSCTHQRVQKAGIIVLDSQG